MVRSVRTTLSGCRDMTPNVMPAMSPSSRLARPWCMSGTVVYVVCEVSPLTPPAKAITPAVTGVIESIIGHMVHCHSSGRVALSVSPRHGPTARHPSTLCAGAPRLHTPHLARASHLMVAPFTPFQRCVMPMKPFGCSHEGAIKVAPMSAPTRRRSDHAGETLKATLPEP